jgi:hypothetical protein
MPGSAHPRVRVFHCERAAGCSEAPPVGKGWQEDGWYDEKAPRYVKYTPPPPPKPGENRFPDSGTPLTEDELRAFPKYDRDKTYSFGALVQTGYVTSPRYVVFQCKRDKCDASPPSSGWQRYGWYGE